MKVISNALGYDVTYKANSRTIELDQPKQVTEGDKVTESVDQQTVEKKIEFIDNRIKSITESRSRLKEAAKLAGTGEPDFSASDAKIAELKVQKDALIAGQAFETGDKPVSPQ